MATLLPNGEQTFVDANGAPLVGGKVYFYVPGTTTPKDTYQDAGASVLNTNPVVLDGAGRAIIYGSGAYRQVVKDAAGNTVWDQITADTSSTANSWAGTSSGSANAQTVTATAFTSANGQSISFLAGFTNTGAFSLNPNGAGPIQVLKDTLGGPVALSGGEVVAGNLAQVVYDSTLGAFHLVGQPATSSFVSVASAGTTDIGSAGSTNVLITGSNVITGFGSSARTSAPLYRLRFNGACTLTHNGASLILPGAANITTAAGDSGLAAYLGSGNWQVLYISKATGQPAVQVLPASLSATTGTPSASAFYRGDGAWSPIITAGTSVAATSGTSIDFTGIPATAKRITVLVSGVSVSGTSPLLVQLGKSAGVETTGYQGEVQYPGVGYGTFSAGFTLMQSNAAANNVHSVVVIHNITGNVWVASIIQAIDNAASTANFGAGSKTLGGTLDRVRLTTVNGTDTFDAGTVNIFYE